jgi:hypothetical protein
MDKYAFRMAGVLAAATIHRWLGGAGIPRRFHVSSLAAAVIAIDAVSAYFSFGLRDSLGSFAGFVAASHLRLPFLEYSLLAVAAGMMLLIVFAESSASQATQLVAAARALPVSRQFLTVARNLPTGLALAVVGIGALPPAVALVVLIGGVDVLHAALAIGLVMAAGLAAGLVVVAAIRAIPWGGRSGLPTTMRYPVAVCVWAGFVVLQVVWLQSSSGQTANVVDWVLEWPLAARWLDAGGSVLLLGEVLIGVAYLVLAVGAYVMAPEPEHYAALQNVTFRWTASLPLPLVRMEMLRLWRTGRFRSIAAVNLILGFLADGAMLWAPASSRKSVAMTAVIPLAVLWMALPLMARGVGRWHVPTQLQLGISPLTWAWSVMAAGFVWTAITAGPPLLALTIIGGDPAIFATGALLTVFGVSLASFVGFVLPAGGENPVGEVAGMIICGILMFVGLWAVGQAFRLPTTEALMLAVLGLGAMPAVGLIELTRWRIDIGTSRA